MDHAGHLVFVFRLDGDTVAAVAHGDNGVLQVGAGAAVYHAGQLVVDPLAGVLDGTADLAQGGAGVVADLILRENTAADFRRKRSQRLQGVEQIIQRIPGNIAVFPAAVSLYPGAVFQNGADGQQLLNPQTAADFQPLQGTPHIPGAAEGDGPLLKQAGERVLGLPLQMFDLPQRSGRLQIFTLPLSQKRRSTAGQLLYDFIVFQRFQCFFIHEYNPFLCYWPDGHRGYPFGNYIPEGQFSNPFYSICFRMKRDKFVGTESGAEFYISS